MDVNAITSLITTIGFPIAMCIMMAWFIKYQMDEYSKQVDSFNKSLDANTQIITKLYEKLGDGK